MANNLIKALFTKTNSTQKGLSDMVRTPFGGAILSWDTNNLNQFGDVYQPNYSALIKEGTQGIAGSGIDLISSNVSMSQILVYKKQNQTDNSEPDDHPFLDIIYGANKPNEYLTIAQMLYRATSRYITIGNEWWLVVKNNSDTPIGLIPLQVREHTQILPITNTMGYVDKWKYIGKDRKEYIFDKNEIIHFKRPSPYENSYGMGIIIQGAKTFDKLNAIDDFQLRAFGNDGAKKLVIYDDGDFGDEGFEKFKEDFRKNYIGNASNTMILPRGLRAEAMSSVPSEMEHTKSYDLVLKDLMSLLKIPPSKLAKIDDVNRANAISAEYDFYNDCLKPVVNVMSDMFTRMLVNNYKNSDDYIVKVKLRRPQDTQYEMEQMKILVAGVTPNSSITEAELRQWAEYPEKKQGALTNEQTKDFIEYMTGK